jgi:hypothetical protein
VSAFCPFNNFGTKFGWSFAPMTTCHVMGTKGYIAF